MALAKNIKSKTELARPNGLSSCRQMVEAIENVRCGSWVGASGHSRYSAIF